MTNTTRLQRIGRVGLATLLISLLLPAAAVAGNGKDKGKVVVDCDRRHGERILQLLVRRAPPGAVLRVRGTCEARLVIDRDRITLRGVDGATFDASQLTSADGEFEPVIHIRGGRAVVLEDLSVQGSPAEGVLVGAGAEATLRRVQVSGSSNVGVLVDNARLQVEGGAFNNNAAGLDAINNASVLLQGSIAAQGNLVFGVAGSGGSALELRGGTMDVSGNGLVGLLVESGTFSVLNFGVSVASNVLANANGFCGVAMVARGAVDLVAPPPAQFTGVHLIQAQHNGSCGFFLSSGSALESPFGAATIQATENPVGMLVVGNSNVAVNGGLQLHDNFGPGLLADGAGVISIGPTDGSPAPLASTISGNGLDVNLAFGSRAEFAGTTVGSVACDGTALARGDATCP